ncbi:type I-E CRISPR-associated endoribonuclease Cas2e [Streptomyces endophytica]|uniref:Type I-E CRISPR-associated endoribonuclease Cas2e n=1 Tax=Streptomyces endophytica TaxID=2991496 RepID=A0ABY6PIV9_9ACTN|nr:type I-E CRISPR-associated endoribonuclease Cas2e [Streptomyces endophytica]UZJ33467.1 type I-E CRISPR-associated endoribonuclease Cas2e [Streptomyces endophytica]
MTVIVLTNCPPGLRGFLTRWMFEISAGVFIGNPSARIREILWAEVEQYAATGRALLAHSTNNEQGFTFQTMDHAWQPVDHEGVTLMRRPKAPPATIPPTGWSKASKRRRFKP